MTVHAVPRGMVRAAAMIGTIEGYMRGFGNDFETEALPGALPRSELAVEMRIWPLCRAAFGDRLHRLARSERTDLALPDPAVGASHRALQPHRRPGLEDRPEHPRRHRQPRPVPLGADPGAGGGPDLGDGDAHHHHRGRRQHPGRHGEPCLSLTQSMEDEYFFSADSELLVAPQEGRLRFATELGVIDLEPKEIAILPRGLVYRVEVLEGPCRGFVCENYGQKFDLPGRGPMGANCMANPRDFKCPVAAFDDRHGVRSRVVIKWCGRFHEAWIDHSPLDVVA